MKPEDYETEDPWGYKSNPWDWRRKERILEAIKIFAPFEKALDIGGGEGWISKDLPAKDIYVFEQSKNAKSRLPENVKGIDCPIGYYDLVISTGTLYSHYDCELFLRLIHQHASKIILTCNILEWESPRINELKQEIYQEEFKYREFHQKLRVFKVDTFS